MVMNLPELFFFLRGSVSRAKKIVLIGSWSRPSRPKSILPMLPKTPMLPRNAAPRQMSTRRESRSTPAASNSMPKSE
jgi:hypothetical protein